MIQCDNCKKDFDQEVMLKCYLPDDESNEDIIEYLCPKCNNGNSYCMACGRFCAGMESFTFGRHPGYCDDCADEIDSAAADDEDWESYDDDEFTKGSLNY